MSEIQRKIEILRNTTDYYGYDAKYKTIAEILSALHERGLDIDNLSPEDIERWKEKLGVGELPTNMATIDQNGEHGNTYTKEKVDELLENSGKNLGNTDLVVPEGEVRVLDVSGAKLQVKGLGNKKADSSFIRRMMMNELGELAYSDTADMVINIPESLTLDYPQPKIITYQVNHIYPTKIPDLSENFKKLQEFMTRIGNAQFIPVKGNQFTLSQIDEGDRVDITNSGAILPHSLKLANDPKICLSVTCDVELPADKNWCFMFSGVGICYQERAGVQSFGFAQGVTENSNGINTSSVGQISIRGNTLFREGLARVVDYGLVETFSIIYTKTGDVINITAIGGRGRTASVNIDAMAFMGSYRFVFNLGSGEQSYVKEQTQLMNFKYYIEN